MRTIRTKIYKFSELTEESKQIAIEQLAPTENVWASENQQSLTDFAKLFGLKINRDGFSQLELALTLTGARLATWFWNNYKSEIYRPKQYWICEGRPNTVGANSKKRESKIFIIEDGCPLTGYYMDCEILKPIFEFMRKPHPKYDFNDIMCQCFNAWESACEKDYEFQCSEAQIVETIESNNYEFHQNGKLY